MNIKELQKKQSEKIQPDIYIAKKKGISRQ